MIPKSELERSQLAPHGINGLDQPSFYGEQQNAESPAFSPAINTELTQWDMEFICWTHDLIKEDANEKKIPRSLSHGHGSVTINSSTV